MFAFPSRCKPSESTVDECELLNSVYAGPRPRLVILAFAVEDDGNRCCWTATCSDARWAASCRSRRTRTWRHVPALARERRSVVAAVLRRVSVHVGDAW